MNKENEHIQNQEIQQNVSDHHNEAHLSTQQEPSCDCHNHKHHHEHHHAHCHEETCGCEHEHLHDKEDRNISGAVKFKVVNLDCANCARKVEAAIQKADFIEDAALNFSSSLLFVKTTEKKDLQELKKQLQDIANDAEPGIVIESYSQATQEEHHVRKSEMFRLICALILFILGMMLSQKLFFAAALGVSGFPVVLQAIRNLCRGEWFDENFLMTVAACGAFAIGEWAEGSAVMVFYEIGELCQSYAVNRSRRSIASLMDIRAEYANVIKNGVEQKITPEEAHVGDIMVIRPGERVALDGILIQGSTALDTSALSGESLPKEAEIGDEILAGSVNLSGLIHVRIVREFTQSSVARILELVENAGSKKAPTEKFITRFARVYTPIVVGGALLVLLVPMLFINGAEFEQWLYRALTFLVVSCPCALVVSVPLGLFAGIGGAGKKGILVKGGNYLEALDSVQTVVFDKTGTLTKGSFQVSAVWSKKLSKEELLEIGAYGEAYSNHPIAKSVCAAYHKTIDKERISDFEEITGRGIHCKIDDKNMYLGNHKLMEQMQIPYEKTAVIGTVIHIASDSEYLGYIVINDELKEHSKQAIQELKQLGVLRCVMLSGDRNEVAQAVGRELQLDEVYAQLLPQQKVEQVEALMKQQSGRLAFVGDGINDAPVLARADIGVAMGGIGSDAAIEAADIVLMKDDPSALAQAIQISKHTKRILRQNIIFSLAVKGAVLLLTVFGLSTMWMGVFADVGVTLLAVMNSMRALRV